MSYGRSAPNVTSSFEKLTITVPHPPSNAIETVTDGVAVKPEAALDDPATENDPHVAGLVVVVGGAGVVVLVEESSSTCR